MEIREVDPFDIHFGDVQLERCWQNIADMGLMRKGQIKDCKENYLKGDYPEIFNYYQDSFLNLPNFKEGEVKEWMKLAEKQLNH